MLLSDRLQERSALRIEAHRPVFYFDLACPFSYLAAERIERGLGEVEWVPAFRVPGDFDVAAAEERAAALRLPLVLPDRFPAPTVGAMRACLYAASGGAGARFAMAAFRMAFCGGFDLDDEKVLSILATDVGIPQAACVAAAGDPGSDDVLAATGRGLERHGMTRLPAVRVGDRWFQGEDSLAGAAALQRDRRRESSLAPTA